MPTLEFKTMMYSDIEHIMPIEITLYSHPWTEGIFNDCIRSGYLCFIAHTENKIAAYGVLSYAAGESHILNISVPRNQQKKGYGKQLLTHMQQQAKKHDASMILLEVRKSNQTAINLYEGQGFNEIGIRKNYYPAHNGKEDAIMFAKQL